jgi:hypothetical protein
VKERWADSSEGKMRNKVYAATDDVEESRRYRILDMEVLDHTLLRT